MDLREYRRGGFNAPTHRAEQELRLGRAELQAEAFDSFGHPFPEDVVILEQAVAYFALQLGGCLHEAAVPLPGGCVQELLLLFLGDGGLSGACLYFLVAAVLIWLAPLQEPLFELIPHRAEIVEQRVAKLIVDLAANGLVTRGE